MSGLFEAALHVQAMRLVCEALADREQNGIEVDWDVLRQMHDQMDAMLQELQHKHRYDSSEIVDLRKDRDNWREEWQRASAAGELMRAEIDSLRQQLRGAHAPAMAQQSEEIAYLRARLDEERSVIASLREQLESALALLTDQRLNAEEQDREIERLRKFADGVRTQVTRYTMSWASWNEIKSALAELDGQPAPVAETAEGGT